MINHQLHVLWQTTGVNADQSNITKQGGKRQFDLSVEGDAMFQLLKPGHVILHGLASTRQPFCRSIILGCIFSLATRGLNWGWTLHRHHRRAEPEQQTGLDAAIPVDEDRGASGAVLSRALMAGLSATGLDEPATTSRGDRHGQQERPSQPLAGWSLWGRRWALSWHKEQLHQRCQPRHLYVLFYR